MSKDRARRFRGLGPFALAICAPAAGLLRWQLQASANLYTDVGMAFYVPDPDLGWRYTGPGPLWLGLDAVLALFLVALAVGVAGLWTRRRAWPRVRAALWATALLASVGPAWAFATGSGPDGKRDTLPVGDLVVASAQGLSGSLPAAPAGRYRVLDHEASAVVALFDAGGERFEARMSGASGAWSGDPGDLRQPMQASISVAAASVDTGISLRTKHAREELRVDEHAQVRFRLHGISSAAQRGPNSVGFRARGAVELIGRTHAVEVTGVMTVAAPAARSRLGLPDRPALILRASFELSLEETAIENDGSFDSDQVPVSVSLILVQETAKVSP